ncbi:MAG: aldo/keto reductase [Spirochaetales bacterium]|nr:aldo/keto reductase [Spirochaetales bacterium]
MNGVSVTDDPRFSKLIFGAWVTGGWYWGGVDDARSHRALKRARELGITAIDTAPMYGMGHSEEVIGRYFQSEGPAEREKWFVATKCGLVWDGDGGSSFFEIPAERSPSGRPVTVYRNLSKQSILRECEQSLGRLGVEVIDLYQIHWPDPSTGLDEALEALQILKQTGKIRHAGVCNFSVEQILAWKKLAGDLPLASDQEKYNLLERKIEQGNLPYSRKNNLPLLAYGPLAQGLLAGGFLRPRDLSATDYRRDAPLFESTYVTGVHERLRRLQGLTEKYEASLSCICLAWVLCAPGVCAALVGLRTEEQVEENAGALSVKLTQEDRNFMTTLFADVPFKGRW